MGERTGWPAFCGGRWRNRGVIAEGGFVPAIDHSVSADISFGSYCHFMDAIRRAITA